MFESIGEKLCKLSEQVFNYREFARQARASGNDAEYENMTRLADRAHRKLRSMVKSRFRQR